MHTTKRVEYCNCNIDINYVMWPVEEIFDTGDRKLLLSMSLHRNDSALVDRLLSEKMITVFFVCLQIMRTTVTHSSVFGPVCQVFKDCSTFSSSFLRRRFYPFAKQLNSPFQPKTFVRFLSTAVIGLVVVYKWQFSISRISLVFMSVLNVENSFHATSKYALLLYLWLLLTPKITRDSASKWTRIFWCTLYIEHHCRHDLRKYFSSSHYCVKYWKLGFPSYYKFQ